MHFGQKCILQLSQHQACSSFVRDFPRNFRLVFLQNSSYKKRVYLGSVYENWFTGCELARRKNLAAKSRSWFYF